MIEAKPRPDFVPVPRQLVIAFEAPQLWMMQPPGRQRIVSVGITTPLYSAWRRDHPRREGERRNRRDHELLKSLSQTLS